jgi:hypothetical protein
MKVVLIVAVAWAFMLAVIIAFFMGASGQRRRSRRDRRR